MLLTTRPSKIKLAIEQEMFAKYSLNTTPILCLKKFLILEMYLVFYAWFPMKFA